MGAGGRQPGKQVEPGGAVLACLQRQPTGELDPTRDPRRNGSRQVEAGQARVILVDEAPDAPIAEYVMVEVQMIATDLPQCQGADQMRTR